MPNTPWVNRIVRYGEEDPSQLVASPWNWRIHPHEQEQALQGVLSEVGYVAPVIVSVRSGYVVDGHLRVAAAISKGQPTIPVAFVDLDESEEKLILSTLDPIGALAATDQEKLDELIGELHASDAHLVQFLASLSPETAKVLGEDTADLTPPVEPVTKPGDLWLLGEHRLLCGDSTKAEDVARLLDGAEPFMMVTDPPYGVNYDPQWRSDAAAKGHLAYAARRVGVVPNDDRSDWREAWALFPGDVVYSWHPAGATSLEHAAALQDSGFKIRIQIIWAKSNFPISRGDYHVRHEPCWYAVRDGKPARRNDDRTQTTLWEINLDRNVEGGHSTQKPVECMARPIRNHEPCDVYDPFVGSGTTIVAAEQLGRRCYAMDISPAYVDVSVRRWETVTGEKAVLAELVGSK